MLAAQAATPGCAMPVCARCYLSILNLSGEFVAYAKPVILFSLFVFPVFVPPAVLEKSISATDGTLQMLISFVAPFGRDRGQCALKQGDSRTIL